MLDQLQLTDYLSEVTPEPAHEPKIYTVSEFLDSINQSLQSTTYTIQGEIEGLKSSGKGTYFNISSVVNGEKSVLNCIIWNFRLQRLGIALRDGLEVKIIGTAKIYKPRGSFSFTAEFITPVGEGELKLAFDALKKRLDAEGYFAPERKKQLPQYVSSIGLITSEQGDAIKDFRTHLGNRGFHIQFYDARVEGVNAVPSIVNGIKWFNEHATDVEVLVITRGGGSLESLQAFNTEDVAKAIYASRIPVISAIGHENDITIADMVADVRASTPTHAGKMLSQPWLLAHETVSTIHETMLSTFRQKVMSISSSLSAFEQSYLTRFSHMIETNTHRIFAIDRSLLSYFHELFRDFYTIQESFLHNVHFLSKALTRQLSVLAQTHQSITHNAQQFLRRMSTRLALYEEKLLLADPTQKLKQGYSIVLNTHGKVVKSTDDVMVHDDIHIRFHKGSVISHITKKTPYDQ